MSDSNDKTRCESTLANAWSGVFSMIFLAFLMARICVTLEVKRKINTNREQPSLHKKTAWNRKVTNCFFFQDKAWLTSITLAAVCHLKRCRCSTVKFWILRNWKGNSWCWVFPLISNYKTPKHIFKNTVTTLTVSGLTLSLKQLFTKHAAYRPHWFLTLKRNCCKLKKGKCF